MATRAQLGASAPLSGLIYDHLGTGGGLQGLVPTYLKANVSLEPSQRPSAVFIVLNYAMRMAFLLSPRTPGYEARCIKCMLTALWASCFVQDTNCEAIQNYTISPRPNVRALYL